MSGDSAIHAVAGAVGGIVAMTATYPLVFLSTRAAVETGEKGKPTYQAFLDIVKREGITGVYSGLNSSLVGIAVTNGAYYYFYESGRAIILRSRKGSKALSTAESMLIGFIAGSVTSIISNPIWVIQTAQAVQTMAESGEQALNTDASSTKKVETNARKLGMLDTIRKIYQMEGMKAFWRGLGPALVLVINPVLQYTVFEQLKNVLIKRKTARLRASGKKAPVAVLSDFDYFLLGALSKLVATGSTYPYIVIKSRLQAGSATAVRYRSALDGILTVMREEGIAGLYKGIGSKLTQSILTAAILFAGQRRIYEIVKKVLRVHFSSV